MDNNNITKFNKNQNIKQRNCLVIILLLSYYFLKLQTNTFNIIAKSANFF